MIDTTGLPQVETRKGYPNPPQYVEPYRRTDGVPLGKKARKRNWRHTEVLTFGERLLDELDPDRQILNPEEQRRICALNDASAVSYLLKADFGNYKNPDLEAATAVFGALAGDGISVPRVILCLRFQTCAQLLEIWSDARAIYKNERFTREDRLEALKCAKEAAIEKNKVVSIIQQLANKLGYIDDDPSPEKVSDLPIVQKPSVGSAPELE